MDINCRNLIPIGEPLDQYITLKVVDCVSKEITENGIGELFVESKIRQCVLTENEQMNSDLGSIATGDLVEIKSGTIYYKTRMNNMVKIFGRKVNLTKIENTIKSNWTVNDACCVFDKDKNSLNLFVQCGNGRKYTKKEIFHGLRQKLLEQEVPTEIYFIDEFPLSCHGKISKIKLLEMIEKPSNHRDYFLTKLQENLPNFNVESTLKLPFLAVGGSSVLALQLINELETRFNLVDRELITMLLSPDVSIEHVLIRLKDHPPNPLTRITSETVSSVSCMWSHDLEKCIDASTTICTVDNKTIVSVGSHSHKLLNVDLASGQILSQVTLPHRIECQVVQFHHYGIVGCHDGFVYCFDIRNGCEKWKYNSNGMVKSRMCIIANCLVFGNYNSEHNLWCLQADDGTFIWNKKIGNKSIYAGIIETPNNHLFVTTLDGVCAIVDVFSGKSVWETKLQSPIFSTPKILQNRIFVAEVLGIVHCIDQCFGKILFSFQANGNIYSSIESISENSICFGCYDKSVYCISFDTDASTFKLLWKVETPGQIFSSAKNFVFDSMCSILVCSTNGTVCILKLNGELVKQFQINGEIFSTPSVADDRAIIASRNNLLYCLDLNELFKKI